MNDPQTLSPMTRRQFSLGMAAAASCAIPLLADAEMAKPVIRIGMCSYMFRKFNPTQVIAFMNELKCPYLNVKDVHLPMTPLADVPGLAAAYRSAGIELTDAGAIYFKVDSEDDVRAKFEYLKAAGVKSFVGAPNRNVIARVERFVKQYDIRMAVHNHGPHDTEWPSPFDIEKVIQSMDHRVGYCIDIGHTARLGVDPVAAIRMAGTRLYNLHVRDLSKPNAKGERIGLPVGDGTLPMRAIFQSIADIKYKYFVDLELEDHEDDPLPDIKKSYLYMTKLVAEMGLSAA